MSQAQNNTQIVSTADLVRKGATILQEPCPRCGAVQIRYKGKVYCTREDDLGAIDSSTGVPQTSTVSPATQATASQTSSQNSDSVRKLLEEKLNNVSKELENTSDFEKQSKLLDLISKYVETLDKIKKTSS